jgi:hypothetical protein
MTEMVEVQVSELENAPLRYAVAVAVGHSVSELMIVGDDTYCNVQDSDGLFMGEISHGQFTIRPWQPDRDWSQCGPLIDEYVTALQQQQRNGECWANVGHGPDRRSGFGSTKKVAACRAIVAAHNGDTVRVPRELWEDN